MQQKMKFRPYSTIGIFSIFISLLFIMCEDPYSSNAEYIYFNGTNYTISIATVSPNAIGPLLPNYSDTIKIFTEANDGDKNSTDHTPPILDAVLSFDAILCDTLLNSSPLGNGEGILGIQNYKSEKLGRNNFRFTYTFKEADVLKADTCN